MSKVVDLLILYFKRFFGCFFERPHSHNLNDSANTQATTHIYSRGYNSTRSHTNSLIHSVSPSTNIFRAQAPGTDIRMVGRGRASDVDPDLGELDAQFLAAFLPPIFILIRDTHRVYIILKKLNKILKIQFIVCSYVFCLYLYIFIQILNQLALLSYVTAMVNDPSSLSFLCSDTGITTVL